MKKYCLISITILIISFQFEMIYSQNFQEIFLYKDDEVFTKNHNEIVECDPEGRITHISGDVNPRLFLYSPESPNGTGIIICPGSGYARMGIENSRFIAERLTEMGITVFILAHRLPKNITGPDKSTVALKDLQKAVFLVRQNADTLGLSSQKIGVWGSSAGGHLAAMLATHYDEPLIDVGNTNLRPDFLILAWPVISFQPGIAHQGSMENLLGKNPDQDKIKYYSADEWVNKYTPQSFLVHAADDRVVPFENSIRFFKALREANVPAELHIYEEGGHTAFGLAPEISNEDSWITQLEIWLRNRQLL